MRVVSALVTVNKKRAEGTSPSKRSHGIAVGNLSLYNLRVKNGCAVVEQKPNKAIDNTHYKCVLSQP